MAKRKIEYEPTPTKVKVVKSKAKAVVAPAAIESENLHKKAKAKAPEKAVDLKDGSAKKKKATVIPESDSDESNSESDSASEHDLESAVTKKKKKDVKEMETETDSASEHDSSDSDSESAEEEVAPKAVVVESAGKKKGAMTTPEETKQEKPVRFQRKWFDNHEIALLRGMNNYNVEKKLDPMSNYSDFYEFVKNSLEGDFVEQQVSRKVRALKRRYKTYVEGRKKPLNAHEHEAIELSKSIWGGAILRKAAATVSNGKTTRATIQAVPALNGKEKVNETTWYFVDKLHVSLGMDKNVVNEALKKMSKAEKGVIEKTWKQIFLDEASMAERKLEVVTQITNIMKRK